MGDVSLVAVNASLTVSFEAEEPYRHDRDRDRSLRSSPRALQRPEHRHRVNRGSADVTARGGAAVVLAIVAAVLVLTIGEPAAATELGNLAASMKAGEWRTLATNNIAIVSQWFSFASVPTPGYDDNCFWWNSKKRQGYITTASHNGGGAPYKGSPLWAFIDDTNTWSEIAPPALPDGPAHCYDGLAWDDENEVLYWRPGMYGTRTIYRFCVNNTPSWCTGKQGVWSTLPDATATGGCYQVANALTYHATMDGGSLLCYDGERGIVQFRESTGSWSGVLPGSLVSGTGPYSVCAEYSRIKRVTVFGCGGGSAMYKIDDNKTITRLQDFAGGGLGLGENNHDLVAEPVTGNFINIGGGGTAANAMYELNPDGNGTWTLVDSDLTTVGKICHTKINTGAACSSEFYGAANPTYGVIMYWKYTGTSSGEVWLYKRKPLDPPAPPTSLTVK